MKLKPWYEVIKPREDLREGKSQDSSEFAVHLDRVRDGTGRKDYTDPEQFFAKTYLASNLLDLSSQVVRRMAGETSHTSPVFNLATNFGGGKTHSLTLLYHLAKHGADSHKWLGVDQIRDKAKVEAVPKGQIAVFVGTEFDSLAGRGEQGEPTRHTPWGEIAWQLGGQKAFDLVKSHDEKRIAPGGDVIRKIIPADEPCLILMDELMNYMSRFRREGLNDQFYDFIMNLSGSLNEKSVLVVSVPASLDLEMTPADQADYERVTKMLDRVGKAMTMTVGAETSEIIRRRLFEWDSKALGADGRVMLPKMAVEACAEYARWVSDHEQQLAGSIPADHAKSYFEQSYPFHPAVLSVFERKWRSVPKFQQTRGILRMLAIWVSQAYSGGYKKDHPDPLITLGSAPLSDAIFRAAVFEQLGSRLLDTAVTTDITGRKDSHAHVLDEEATDAIRQERLHQKIASVVFFESNGGTTKGEATIPEIRLATGHPGMDLGNIETSLEALLDKSYYLIVEKNHYKFSLKENLNKRFTDKKANIKVAAVEEIIKQEIQKVFSSREGVDRIFFPEKSIQIPDRPAITIVIGDMGRSLAEEKQTFNYVESLAKECGSSARTFKNSLIWVLPETGHVMQEEARKYLAWRAIDEDADELKLDETQQRTLSENLKKSERDLKEAVWRSFKNVVLLAKDGSLQKVDLGLVHSSSATTPIDYIINRLTSDGLFDKGISVRKLLQNWSGAFTEWSTKSVRDALYASPHFPRIIRGNDAVKDAVAKGVSSGDLAYVTKGKSGGYDTFSYQTSISPEEIEISDDTFIIKKETADAHKAGATTPTAVTAPTISPASGVVSQPETIVSSLEIGSQTQSENTSMFEWKGKVPAQKWMNFYTRVVSKIAPIQDIELEVTLRVEPHGGISNQKIEEAKSALRELGLD